MTDMDKLDAIRQDLQELKDDFKLHKVEIRPVLETIPSLLKDMEHQKDSTAILWKQIEDHRSMLLEVSKILAGSRNKPPVCPGPLLEARIVNLEGATKTLESCKVDDVWVSEHEKNDTEKWTGHDKADKTYHTLTYFIVTIILGSALTIIYNAMGGRPLIVP